VPASAAETPCQLGNGISHVVNIVFDNVHFSRDNPNVPSDLEQMPHLLNFLKQNGTIFSNSHTPLIAHTANDSLTIYTGLYGDRHGQPLTNSYRPTTPTTADPPGHSRTGPHRVRHEERGTDDGARHHALDGLLGHGPGERCSEPGHPRAVGAVHPSRVHGR
jgi:hypothetical protein